MLGILGTRAHFVLTFMFMVSIYSVEQLNYTYIHACLFNVSLYVYVPSIDFQNKFYILFPFGLTSVLQGKVYTYQQLSSLTV